MFTGMNILEVQYTKSTFIVLEQNGTFLSAISITYHHNHTIMVQWFHALVCIVYHSQKCLRNNIWLFACLDHSNITSAKVFQYTLLAICLLGLYLTTRHSLCTQQEGHRSC